MKQWLLLGVAALAVAGCARVETPPPGGPDAPIPVEGEAP